jgi:hypothetical protein
LWRTGPRLRRHTGSFASIYRPVLPIPSRPRPPRRSATWTLPSRRTDAPSLSCAGPAAGPNGSIARRPGRPERRSC